MTALLGWVNIIKDATITATSYEADMPPESVAGDLGAASMGWQTLPGVTNAVMTVVPATAGSLVRAISFHRTNWTYLAQIAVGVSFGGASMFSTIVTGPAVGFGQVVIILPAAVYADTITIAIDDPSNPDGFLNVPLMFVGDMWEPTYPLANGSGYGRSRAQDVQVTRGGTKIITPLYDARYFRFDMKAVPDTEAWNSLGEIDRYANTGNNYLFVPEQSSGDIAREAVFGTLELDEISWGLGAVKVRSATGKITERL